MAHELFSVDALHARLEAAYLHTVEMLKQHGAILSLEDLLDIDRHFEEFEPHPNRVAVEQDVKDFCVKYHIWHKRGGDVYNTMTAYLHPYTAEPSLLATIGKVYALLYFMDDYIGNEKQKHLSEEERAQARGLLERLVMYLSFPAQGYKTDPNVLTDSPMEFVIRTLIEEIETEVRSILDPDRVAWFKQFARHLLQHLNKAIVEQDTGGLISVPEYIAVRDEVSGMKPAVLLMEFGSRNYLPRRQLDKLGLLDAIEELELLCIRYGGLVNDFFSFYKEVMEDRAVFNLVSIVYLNNASGDSPREFLNGVRDAANLIIEMKDRFFSLRNEVWAYTDDLSHTDLAVAEQINRHLEDLTGGVLATWHWQLEAGNPRYARPGADVIFSEISLTGGNDRRTVQSFADIASLLVV